MDFSVRRITGTLLLIVNLQLTGYALQRETKKQPHIILIIADDLVSIIILSLCYEPLDQWSAVLLDSGPHSQIKKRVHGPDKNKHFIYLSLKLFTMKKNNVLNHMSDADHCYR